MASGEHEFTAFYDATWARTVACAYAVTGDLGAAEEAAQEAYSRLSVDVAERERAAQPADQGG